MHANADKTKQAIEVIRSTKDMVGDLLSDTPEFQTRANHVFDMLANGLEFAIGAASTQKVKAPIAPTGPRTVMGVTVPDEVKPMTERLSEAMPDKTDLDKLREDVDKAYKAFPTLSNKEIRNSLSDLELRGVARRAGLKVTKTEPAHITDSLITEIKAAIVEKAELDKAKEVAEADAEKIVADNALSAESEEAKPTPPKKK